MSANRLFQILYLLLERGRMTAEDLAVRLEVSVRTIYRDIDTLSAAGIPVFTAQGKGGGVSLMDGYVYRGGTVSAAHRPAKPSRSRKRRCSLQTFRSLPPQ